MLLKWLGVPIQLCLTALSDACRLTAVKDGKAWLVPDEGPPINREGEASWVPSWSQEREVTQEQDIFELLQVPYRRPSERNCG